MTPGMHLRIGPATLLRGHTSYHGAANNTHKTGIPRPGNGGPRSLRTPESHLAQGIVGCPKSHALAAAGRYHGPVVNLITCGWMCKQQVTTYAIILLFELAHIILVMMPAYHHNYLGT